MLCSVFSTTPSFVIQKNNFKRMAAVYTRGQFECCLVNLREFSEINNDIYNNL